MKRDIGYRLPFILMFILGIFFVAQHYVPHPAVQGGAAVIEQWFQPFGAFILFVATAGLMARHAGRVRRFEKRWGYSVVTLISAVGMFLAGMIGGMEEGSLFATWFEYLITPIEATMFSLLAFFIASAAFRAFRARTPQATILLVSALVVMLGLVPYVEERVPFFAKVSAFLLQYPNTAAKRAIMIGVALGAISVAIKNIVGIDRTILGKRH